MSVHLDFGSLANIMTTLRTFTQIASEYIQLHLMHVVMQLIQLQNVTLLTF